MKINFKKLLSFVLTLVVLFTLVACGETGEVETVLKDIIETPNDIPSLDTLEYVQYPDKPASVNSGELGDMPYIGNATTYGQSYKIEQEDSHITVKFNEVDRWEYVLIPINDFNEEYQNIKITATASNVQKVSVTALYYEMYDLGLPAVTTCMSDVGTTEQYYIMELGKDNLLDKSYYPLEDTLGSQTVFAICIFIDSNPSQSVVNKDTQTESVFEITAIEFLKDGDPAIKESYVAPTLRAGYVDPGYSIDTNEETGAYTITKSGNAQIYESGTLDIVNYSSDFSAFNIKFTTQNINTMVLELQFTGGKAEWVTKTEIFRITNLEDGEHEFYIDFSFNQPQDSTTWEYVPGYYVKNYRCTGIAFFLDTSLASDVKDETGICVVNELKFDRLATDGTIISKGWNAGGSAITLGDDLANGGIGTINYTWYSGWECLTMPVANYEPANKLIIQLQANDGLKYLGIALACGQVATGEAVLSSSWTSIQEKMVTPEPKGNEVEGVVETIVFDSATNIYTITFDFTNATKLDKYEGKSINELMITGLRFYFTDANNKDVFDGSREIRFISVQFSE